jgi:nucleoside-diphosphate-sugar epimerase
MPRNRSSQKNSDASKSRHFLVTGGAGFLGINLIRYLLENGHRVASLDFAPFTYPDVKPRVRVVNGDIRHTATVDRAMEGVNTVIHCAAALPLYAPADIRSTEVDGTRNILESARRHQVERVIHVSSTAVYGIPDHHPLVEDDRVQGVGPYGEAKVMAEEICLEYRQEGMCVPIIRPKSFVGPERLGVFAMLFEWADAGKNFPLLGDGRNRYQLLDVEDLCEAILLCATGDEAAVSDTFNIGAREYTTMREDFQAVLDAAGHGKKIYCFPEGPMIWALRSLERLGLSPLYKWVYETAGKDSFVSIERAETVLGFTPRYSNKEALVRNFEWYRRNKDEIAQAAGVSHRVPWNQGALKVARAVF